MIKPMHNSALAGLQRAQAGMRTAASGIAHAPRQDRPTDLNRSLVELRQHEHAAQANIQTLKTANESIGVLIDELV